MWRSSDEQLIERARRWLWWRRPLGIGFMLFGVVAMVASYDLYEQVNELAKVMAESEAVAEREGAEVVPLTPVLNFQAGFIAGNAAWIGLCMLFGGFLSAFTRDRKTEILLRLWDERRRGEGEG
ncbi:MAG: hypothetical protein WD294_10125 [Phycisphaeraceae bacterium]